MKPLTVLVHCFLLFAAGCSGQSPFTQPDYAAWNSIKEGDSEASVEARLGKPSKRGNPDDPDGDNYLAYYGKLDFRNDLIPRPYDFYVNYWSATRTVSFRNNPFTGRADIPLTKAPLAPVLVHPLPGEIIDYFPRYIDFRWTPPPGDYPMVFEIELNPQEQDGWTYTVIKKETTVPALSFAWVGRNEGAWRVRARNKYGTGPWSEIQRFKSKV